MQRKSVLHGVRGGVTALLVDVDAARHKRVLVATNSRPYCLGHTPERSGPVSYGEHITKGGRMIHVAERPGEGAYDIAFVYVPFDAREAPHVDVEQLGAQRVPIIALVCPCLANFYPEWVAAMRAPGSPVHRVEQIADCGAELTMGFLFDQLAQ